VGRFDVKMTSCVASQHWNKNQFFYGFPYLRVLYPVVTLKRGYYFKLNYSKDLTTKSKHISENLGASCQNDCGKCHQRQSWREGEWDKDLLRRLRSRELGQKRA
jgi:hypothetical protein